MFDVKKLPNNPGMARRLLGFAQFNHMVFDEKLVELAMEDLVQPSDLEAFPKELPETAISSIQHIRDWNGRAMLFCSAYDDARRVALANIWLKEPGSTLIMASPKFYAEWAELVLSIWPEAKISIFGNPRYEGSKLQYPDGVSFKETPDYEADFFITSYSGILWNSFLSHKTVDQTIVEELDSPSALPGRWEHTVVSIFREIPTPLFIQNIHALPSDAGRDILASLKTPTSKAVQFLMSHVGNLLWAGIPIFKLAGFTKEAEEYLVQRNYSGSDFSSILSLLGVSSHLLETNEANRKEIVFKDSSLKLALKQKSHSGLHRISARERELVASEGMSMSDIVRRALDSDRASQGLLGALKTSQWATLKSQHVRLCYTGLANRLTRNLFLVEDNHLKRQLHLQFGVTIEDLSKAENPKLLLARFYYPTDHGLLDWRQQYNLKPLSNLIVSLDELIENENLLKHANFLFLPEMPLDREDFDSLKAAADIQGTRIVLNVIESSHEEEIFKQLIEKP